MFNKRLLDLGSLDLNNYEFTEVIFEEKGSLDMYREKAISYGDTEVYLKSDKDNNPPLLIRIEWKRNKQPYFICPVCGSTRRILHYPTNLDLESGRKWTCRKCVVDDVVLEYFLVGRFIKDSEEYVKKSDFNPETIRPNIRMNRMYLSTQVKSTSFRRVISYIEGLFCSLGYQLDSENIGDLLVLNDDVLGYNRFTSTGRDRSTSRVNKCAKFCGIMQDYIYENRKSIMQKYYIYRELAAEKKNRYRNILADFARDEKSHIVFREVLSETCPYHNDFDFEKDLEAIVLNYIEKRFTAILQNYFIYMEAIIDKKISYRPLIAKYAKDEKGHLVFSQFLTDMCALYSENNRQTISNQKIEAAILEMKVDAEKESVAFAENVVKDYIVQKNRPAPVDISSLM